MESEIAGVIGVLGVVGFILEIYALHVIHEAIKLSKNNKRDSEVFKVQFKKLWSELNNLKEDVKCLKE